MTPEEKAKAYDEIVFLIEKQNGIIPEDAILDSNEDGLIADTIRHKKQMKQKSKPKFKVGDWVVHDMSDGRKVIRQIINMTNKSYILDGEDFNVFYFNDLENDYHLWTIEDAKDGDVLFQDLMDGKTFIYNGTSPNMEILYSFIISNDGEDVLPYHIGKPNTGIGNIEDNKNIIHPATKEQRDTLMKTMKEAGWEFVFEKRELKRIEQKSEPKFHEGDFIVHHGTENIYQVVAVINNQYQLKYGDTYILQNCADVDRCARLYDVARDAKDGDVLAVNNEVFIYAHRKQMYSIAVAHCFVDSAGGFYFDGEFGYTEKGNLIHPATKEQCDLLFQKMKEARYEWDAEKKVLKKIGYEIEIPFGTKDSELQEVTYYIPKGFHAEIDDDKVVIKKGEKPTAWSEEDETKLKSACALIKNTSLNGNEGVVDSTIDWLKSLKDRYIWKPSDEQMEALEHFIVYHNGSTNYAKDLEELRLQLKKLRKG